MKVSKINQEEYEVLKESLSEGYKWVVRDKSGEVYVYEKEPYKNKSFWNWDDESDFYSLGYDLLQFIKWEDEEPYNIAELIKEYEKDYKGSWEHAIEFSKEMRRESEETEVNEMDKEKLLDLLDRQTFAYHEMQPESPEDYTAEYKKGYNEGLKFAIAYIDQLDEPEKVVVPEFVGKFIEECKKSTFKTLFYVFAQAENRDFNLIPYEVYDWMIEGSNDELFARAWLEGYTVEKEPLYRARLKVITAEFIASYLRTQSSDAEDRLKALEIGSKYIHEDYRHLSEFTEDELKRLNIWDSEQWEVEEVSE